MPKPNNNGMGPIHDGYKYPMIETKPPARESLMQKIKEATTGTARPGMRSVETKPSKESARAIADRKDQTKKLQGGY